MADAAYTFPREFQRNVLRLILLDRETLAQHRPALSSTHFTDETYRWIAEATFNVFDSAGAHPTRESVLQAAIDECPGSLDPEEIEAEVRALYEDGLPEDAKYVREKILTFSLHQRLRGAAAQAEEMLAEGKYAEWVSAVNLANSTVEESSGATLDYREGYRDLVFKMEDLYKDAIPTGLGGTAIDTHLDGGGLCPGELGLFLGLPSYHKTTALVNIGYKAMSLGKKVAHFTFEVSHRKLTVRYNCLVSGMSKSEIVMNKKGADARIAKWLASHGGDVRVVYEPENTMTLAALEARINRWAVSGWKPDLLLVDYGALLKPSQDYGGVKRFQHEELYNGLRRLGGVLQIPVWSAQQSGREGETAMKAGGVITMMNAAEAFEPIRRADIVITLNQTPEEVHDGVLRFYGAKVREGARGWEETTRIDASRFTFKPLIDEVTDRQQQSEKSPSGDIPPPPPPPDDDDAPPIVGLRPGERLTKHGEILPPPEPPEDA